MMDKKSNILSSKITFNLIMLVAIIVWALAFPFIKIGLGELSFINLTILRLFLVCGCFLLLTLILKNKLSPIDKKDIFSFFLLGFFGVVVYHLGLNYGELLISAGAASLIIATIPIFILILAAIFLKERLNNFKLLGIVIAFCGVIVISIFGKKDTSFEINYIFAFLSVLIAALMGAFYTIAGKKLLKKYNGFSLTMYAILFGSIGLIPFTLPYVNDNFVLEISNLSLEGWFAVLFLAVFSTVIGYSIWYIALEIRTASELSVYLYAIPVVASLASFILFGDEITEMYIVGGFLVIFGLYVINSNNNFLKRKKLIKK